MVRDVLLVVVRFVVGAPVRAVAVDVVAPPVFPSVVRVGGFERVGDALVDGGGVVVGGVGVAGEVLFDRVEAGGGVIGYCRGLLLLENWLLLLENWLLLLEGGLVLWSVVLVSSQVLLGWCGRIGMW